MGRKTQLEKFDKKWGKSYMDKQSIIEDAKKREDNKPELHKMDNAEELMESGNIREAAVVFSHEGMGAFAQMFANTVESTINRVLADRLETFMQEAMKDVENTVSKIIEAKLIEALEGVSAGMKSFTLPINTEKMVEKAIESSMQKTFKVKPSEEVTINVPDVDLYPSGYTEVETDEIVLTPPKKEDIVKPVINWTEEKEAVADDVWVVTNISGEGIDLPQPDIEEGHRIGTSVQDMEIVTPYIMAIFHKYSGKVIKSKDIMKILLGEYGIRFGNPTMTLRKLMSKDPGVENVGFGLYKYEEKNFKPTL